LTVKASVSLKNNGLREWGWSGSLVGSFRASDQEIPAPLCRRCKAFLTPVPLAFLLSASAETVPKDSKAPQMKRGVIRHDQVIPG
jgi:hypothetical protein